MLYLGGFMGRDPVITREGLQQLIEQGDLRYIYSDARGTGDQASISTWVRNTCAVVQGYGTNTQNAGAPDGTQNRGNMVVSLYDCG